MALKDIPVDKTYVITLPHNSARLRLAREQLSRIGIDATPFMGIYPKVLDIRHSNDRFTQGMVGCYLSHYMIFHEAVANQWDSFLVFEDDLQLVPGFEKLWDAAFPHLPDDWEFLWLGYAIHEGVDRSKIVKHNPYWITSPSHWGTQAYMVRGKEAIAKIFSGLQTMTEQIDLQLVQQTLPRQNIRQYSIYPSAVRQSNSGTDVQRVGNINPPQVQELWRN